MEHLIEISGREISLITTLLKMASWQQLRFTPLPQMVMGSTTFLEMSGNGARTPGAMQTKAK